MKNKKSLPLHTEILEFDLQRIDLSIRLLKLLNTNFDTLVSEEPDKIDKINKEHIEFLKDEFLKYFTIEKLSFQTYSLSGLELLSVKRSVSNFGFEIIEWAYLYINFHKYHYLDEINSQFENSIKFNHENKRTKYDDQNREQAEKIKIYLKSLMLSYLNIQNKKNSFKFESFLIKELLIKLEILIENLSIKYSVDDITKNRINVFNEQFPFYNNIYYQKLSTLLYRSLNFFPEVKSKKFVSDYFNESNNIGDMISAINIIESKELKNIISDRISKINVGDYVNSRFFISELESALIETINSESYWQQYTEPL